MMRKNFLILLALCLTLSFVGCSAFNSTGNQEKRIHFELLSKDADLSEAPGVVVEPKKAPYNLGGWTADSMVSWEVELPEDGQYAFKITYSRPGQYPMARGILRIETADGGIHDLNFHADPTGKSKNKDDWTVYITKDAIGDNLTAGKALISVIPNFEPGDDIPEYFINLRSIDVTGTPNKDKPTSKDQQTNEDTLSSEDKKPALENAYKIIIDGENVTKNMSLIMHNDDLYAEVSSYFDALTCNGNPIVYCEYNQKKGDICVYSWATDVMIMQFQGGTNIGKTLIDDVNDEWKEIRLDSDIYVDSEKNAHIPVKAMTNYLTSSGRLVATMEE